MHYITLFSALEQITSKRKLVFTQLDSILAQLDTYNRNPRDFKKRMGGKMAKFVYAAKTYYTETK